MRIVRSVSVVSVFLLLGAGCPGDDPVSPDGDLEIGTWGGENVTVMVEQQIAHVHIGCTNGDFAVPIAVDLDNRINASGSYLLRAYPVAVGPALPAQLAGVLNGRRLTFTVAVNDTVEKKLVVLGPVAVTLGEDPRMGPCPICAGRVSVTAAATRGRFRTRSIE